MADRRLRARGECERVYMASSLAVLHATAASGMFRTVTRVIHNCYFEARRAVWRALNIECSAIQSEMQRVLGPTNPTIQCAACPLQGCR
jgi:hypothetical protein